MYQGCSAESATRAHYSLPVVLLIGFVVLMTTLDCPPAGIIPVVPHCFHCKQLVVAASDVCGFQRQSASMERWEAWGEFVLNVRPVLLGGKLLCICVYCVVYLVVFTW